MEKLSAIVITKNEYPNIDGFLSSLEFADEIVVVDSYSTDGTAEKLMETEGITFFQKEFKNFADQKNFALSQAENDWVLFVDADERIDPDLRQEIKDILAAPRADIVAYAARFRYFFGDSPIRYSGFQTARAYRLFRRTRCRYSEKMPVHEDLVIDGGEAELKNRILHFSFRDAEHYKEKMKLYAHIKARMLFQEGEKSNILTRLIKPVYRFFNHYIMRLGILDGKLGFKISILNAYEVLERYRELDRLYDQEDEG